MLRREAVGLFQAGGSAKCRAGTRTTLGRGRDSASTGWVQCSPGSREASTVTGYSELIGAYQKGHPPARLLLPLGRFKGGRGSAGFQIFQDACDSGGKRGLEEQTSDLSWMKQNAENH